MTLYVEYQNLARSYHAAAFRCLEAFSEYKKLGLAHAAQEYLRSAKDYQQCARKYASLAMGRLN